MPLDARDTTKVGVRAREYLLLATVTSFPRLWRVLSLVKPFEEATYVRWCTTEDATADKPATSFASLSVLLGEMLVHKIITSAQIPTIAYRT